jgi:hypothetical protein
MTPVRAVLDVGQLLQQPERVSQLSIEEARALVTQLASLLVLLSTRASEPSPAVISASPEIWLSPEQVEHRFGLSNTWLHEHRRQLSALGIVSRPSRKVRLYDPEKLARFLESRRQSATAQPFR